MAKIAEKPIGTDGHILIVGGAGSGKSAGIAIPTLKYQWKAPALVIDIKGELLRESHRPRAYVFNPANPQVTGYDPFYLLHTTDNPIPYIQDIAHALIPIPPDTREPYFKMSAQSILTGHLLFAYKQGYSFVEAIDTLLSTDTKDIFDVEMQDEQVRKYLMKPAKSGERTLGTTMTELSNGVLLFATDPEIQDALGKSNIITPDLLEQGYDIFLQIPEYRLEHWQNLTALIIQQFLRHFERRPEKRSNVPILFMLDEFPRLGKIEAIRHALATLRSKKITICLIIQSLAQLDTTYGHDQRKEILDNCPYKAILNAADADTQEYFSRLYGVEDRVKISQTRSGYDSTFLNLLTGTQRSVSVNETTEEKRKIKPEDFSDLGDNIVLFTPQGKRIIKKRYYFNEPDYVPTAKPAPQYPQGQQEQPAYYHPSYSQHEYTYHPPDKASWKAIEYPPEPPEYQALEAKRNQRIHEMLEAYQSSDVIPPKAPLTKQVEQAVEEYRAREAERNRQQEQPQQRWGYPPETLMQITQVTEELPPYQQAIEQYRAREAEGERQQESPESRVIPPRQLEPPEQSSEQKFDLWGRVLRSRALKTPETPEPVSPTKPKPEQPKAQGILDTIRQDLSIPPPYQPKKKGRPKKS